MHTYENLELMTVVQLTAIYNDLGPKANLNPIKKFTDKPTALKRLAPLVELVSKQMAADLEKKAEKKVGKPTKIPHVSVSARCVGLIEEGLTNEAIWDIVKVEFNLDDKKKSYPAWNRAMMVRKALLGK